MTGSNVMNLMQANQIDISKLAGSFTAVTNKSSISDSFHSLMTQNYSNSVGLVQPQADYTVTAENKTQKIETDTSMSTEYERYQFKDNDIKKNDVKSFEEEASEVAEAIGEFKEELMQTIADDLGVDVEKIEEVLAQLGFGLMDLLEPQNLVAFVQELTGVELPTELLMNDNFQQLLVDINSMTSELVKDTGFSIEELQEFSEYLDENPTFSTVMENVDSKVIEIVAEDKEYGKEDINLSSRNIEATVSNAEDEVKETITVETDNDNHFERDDMKETHHQPVITASEQNVEGSQNVFESFVEHVSSYSSVDTQQIIEQIVEQVKISVQNSETSIEMQLNPENLGKVYMNISSKEGAVNAQFYASNETVKEALEMQIITLKENLSQAGVKVDAIEVSVGTHEFERNLDQNQKREEENGEYQELISSTRRRNINIDFLDELSGIMSEEEALVAQIMRDNGNSVDLTA